MAQASHESLDSVTYNTLEFHELELKGRIGGGGFAVIEDGRYKGKKVAVKMLFDPSNSKSNKQEFIDELVVHSQLNHENIVKFEGACITPPNLCMVMEHCPYSLYDVIHTEKMDYDEAFIIQAALDLARGIKYCHEQSPSVIHRDIKSHNLIFDEDFILKICDFGSVHLLDKRIGTPQYMAPELLLGKLFGKEVDIYSFGVVLWELCKKEIPFEGFDVAAIKENVLERGLRLPIPDCHPALANIMKRCWDQNPRNRPSAKQLVQELSKITPRSSALDNCGGDILDGLM
eukprot:TRINITY_DN3077_c0_g2_i1.p1 TRINITY_DN3077_c0_g2~~TRINITY_DN3077_c0_g2_i1.p1  ORF type:complete len:288 (+),score=76.67 TRINITY_DN3077_c0_g2_i1:136-999(+)